jgi:hypothetical protein
MCLGVTEAAENTVRVYIGMEYECPRGHRFFCSAPDKVIKVLGNTAVKVLGFFPLLIFFEIMC